MPSAQYLANRPRVSPFAGAPASVVNAMRGYNPNAILQGQGLAGVAQRGAANRDYASNMRKAMLEAKTGVTGFPGSVSGTGGIGGGIFGGGSMGVSTGIDGGGFLPQLNSARGNLLAGTPGLSGNQQSELSRLYGNIANPALRAADLSLSRTAAEQGADLDYEGQKARANASLGWGNLGARLSELNTNSQLQGMGNDNQLAAMILQMLQGGM